MNAAPPVSRAQPSNAAVQANAPDPAASAPTRGRNQDFAATLSEAGKPLRKNGANKHQVSSVSGSPLPASGNQPPPAPTSAPPAKTDGSAGVAASAAPEAAANGAATAVKGATGYAQASAPGEVAAAAAPQGKAPEATVSLKSGSLDPATPLDPAAEPAPTAPQAVTAPALSDSPVPRVGIDSTAAPASDAKMPHAASIRIAATPGTSNAARVPAATLDNAAKDSGTFAPGNSAPSAGQAPNDSSVSGGPMAGADAAAQSVMAAAIAQGASAPAPESTSAFDPTHDTGLPSGAASVSPAAADAAAAAASVALMAHAAAASTSAAVTAATTASVAQALSVSAGAGAADKRSRGNGADSALSGAANDGSAGAAQLLTSNTSTDSVPMATFKIAAGVDTAQFGQGVADRVSLMVDSNLTNVKLQVNPPALGPIEVRIALQGGHAQVWLSSHSAVTRDALESSSSKLREMLGSQGFSQVSVDISQRSFQERSPQSQGYDAAPAIRTSAPSAAQASLSISRSASGLLDAYA